MVGAGLVLLGLLAIFAGLEIGVLGVALGVFALLAAVVIGVIFGPLLGGRHLTRSAREAHPAEPWRWREDWAAGVVDGRPMGVAAMLAADRFHHVRLTLAVSPVAIGRECAGRIEIAEGAAALDFSRPLLAELRCVHRRVRGSGKNRSESETEYWREEQALTLEPYAQGARAAWKAGIPADRPATTLEHPNDGVRWELRIRQAIDGADLDFTFDLPVFRIDDATFAAAAGPGLAAALAVTPPLPPAPPAPESGVQLHREADGLRVTVAPGRHAGFSWLLLGLAMVFVGTAAVQAAAAEWPVAVIAGLIALPMLYGVLRLRYRRVEVEADAAQVVVRTALLGVARASALPAERVRHLQMVVGMTVGPTPYWDVRAISMAGASLTLVPSMADEAAAKYVTQALATVLQVPVAPPKRPGLPDGAVRA